MIAAIDGRMVLVSVEGATYGLSNLLANIMALRVVVSARVGQFSGCSGDDIGVEVADGGKWPEWNMPW